MKKQNNIKKDITTIKSYLINSFYYDSDYKYTISKISKNTDVSKDTIKLVIDMLKRKKLIENNYEFKLTLDAIEFLENNLKTLKVIYIQLLLLLFLFIPTIAFLQYHY